MAYFRNNTVNLLNLHYGIHAVAMTGGGMFYAVYLLKAGVSAPGVLMTMAAILVRPVSHPPRHCAAGRARCACGRW